MPVEYVIGPELDRDPVARHADRAGDQNLRVDRLPVLEGDATVKAGDAADMRLFADVAEEPGAFQVRDDDAADLPGIIPRAAFRR